MANEYLQRTPTSTGNRRVWTWSGWLKLNSLSTSYTSVMEAFTGASDVYCTIALNSNNININQDNGAGGVMLIAASPLHRDPSSWFHLLVSVDTTQTLAQNRVRIYVNGDEEVVTYSTTPSINFETHFNRTGGHRIGTRWALSGYINAEYTDVFLIDGQALTPDVFGFYKQGKGYISAGSTQATDFRPGQWVPKTPRVIKTEINRRGGFGVNGFYLPMNDGNNFGADFHGDPNSIITLNEKLPQPRVGVATTATAGIGYTDALRADPYAANLVLALPFVSGGLSSGFGDYAPSIKGSGSAKSLTNTTAVSIATTAGYYGTAANFGGSHYLTASYNSDFNFGTGDFTVEMWVYPTAVSDIRGLFAVSGGSGGNPKMVFHLNSGTPSVHYNGLTNASDIYTAASSAIPANQWTHLAYVRKGTTWIWFANGVATGTGSNTTVITFTSQPYYIGYGGEGYFAAFNGYIQDLRIYKGVAKYTSGFDVPRPYAPIGIATWRAVPDTTANNFCTWNAVQNSMSLTDGNLTCTGTGANQEVYSTIGITTGKWYVEARTNVGTYNHFGVRANSTATYGSDYRLIARDDGNVYGDTSQGQVGTLSSGYASTGNIVAMAIDGNLGQITYYVNGVNVGGPYSIYQYSSSSLPTPYKIYNLVNSGDSLTVNFGQNPTFSGNTTAGTFTDSNGKGLFKYQPPSGFLALCEDNLPTPAISDPGKYFKTVLYTGDGNSGRSIVGVGFTPDLVWIKVRTQPYDHNLFDSVRGSGFALRSNLTVTEQNLVSDFNGFSADGFSINQSTASLNLSPQTYAAWCWRAGAGTTSTNTNGSITSVVSVNQDAGFSIVSWTGNGVAGASVGHGLGKSPSMIITKDRDATKNWNTYHKSLGATNIVLLNATNASTSADNYYNTTPTSTIFYNHAGNPSFGSQQNINGNRYVSYCWAEIEGYSKFGSYTGNGSADGPFVYCGFKPAWVMIKMSSSTGNWCIHDSSRGPVNVMNEQLQANLSNVESGSGGLIDFLSNGFKIRATSTDLNTSTGTYIFAAFAESPFQTANAK